MSRLGKACVFVCARAMAIACGLLLGVETARAVQIENVTVAPRDAATATGELFRRDMGKAIMQGASVWFMDLMGGMYDSEEVVKELRKTMETGRQIYFDAGKNNRQVAVVLSAKDAYYHREGEPLLGPMIEQFKQHQLECMGLGYDDLILDNLKYLSAEETAQYKFWIFPSLIHLTGEARGLIRQHCLRNNNYVLWIHAPDAVSPSGIDLKQTEALTGFQCRYTLTPGELMVITRKRPHPFLNSRSSPFVYGMQGELSPDVLKYLIRLPARSRITDLYAGQVLADDSDVITPQVRENQALLFHYQPGRAANR